MCVPVRLQTPHMRPTVCLSRLELGISLDTSTPSTQDQETHRTCGDRVWSQKRRIFSSSGILKPVRSKCSAIVKAIASSFLRCRRTTSEAAAVCCLSLVSDDAGDCTAESLRRLPLVGCGASCSISDVTRGSKAVFDGGTPPSNTSNSWGCTVHDIRFADSVSIVRERSCCLAASWTRRLSATSAECSTSCALCCSCHVIAAIAACLRRLLISLGSLYASNVPFVVIRNQPLHNRPSQFLVSKSLNALAFSMTQRNDTSTDKLWC